VSCCAKWKVSEQETSHRLTLWSTFLKDVKLEDQRKLKCQVNTGEYMHLNNITDINCLRYITHTPMCVMHPRTVCYWLMSRSYWTMQWVLDEMTAWPCQRVHGHVLLGVSLKNVSLSMSRQFYLLKPYGCQQRQNIHQLYITLYFNFTIQNRLLKPLKQLILEA
jgi:hypothetical protein